jgi:hypothetical protein
MAMFSPDGPSRTAACPYRPGPLMGAGRAPTRLALNRSGIEMRKPASLN